jgi:hypothetical protein
VPANQHRVGDRDDRQRDHAIAHARRLLVAILVPTLLRDVPIYDALSEHTARRERAVRSKDRSG